MDHFSLHVSLDILGEIKLNLLNAEKYLKLVFWIDKKLNDALFHELAYLNKLVICSSLLNIVIPIEKHKKYWYFYFFEWFNQ